MSLDDKKIPEPIKPSKPLNPEYKNMSKVEAETFIKNQYAVCRREANTIKKTDKKRQKEKECNRKAEEAKEEWYKEHGVSEQIDIYNKNGGRKGSRTRRHRKKTTKRRKGRKTRKTRRNRKH